MNSKVLADPQLSFLHRLEIMLYLPSTAGRGLEQDNIPKAPGMPVGYLKPVAFLLPAPQILPAVSNVSWDQGS